MRRLRFISSATTFVLLLAGFGTAGAAEKENGKRKANDPQGVERLMGRTGGEARVSVSDATGAVSFVGFEAGFHGDLMAESTAGAREKARAFVHEYSRMLGLQDDAEVSLVGERTDKLGQRHLTFEQSYRGVPVFAGMVRAHFEGDGRLVAVNGNLIPGIRVNPVPSRSATDAAAMAIALISGENEGREVYARSGILTIYRTGLARGTDGESYLTWQIEVGNDSDIREFVYVDAHSGKVVDRLPGIYDAMFRRAYDGGFLPNVPPDYPAGPEWVEGDPFPTGNTEMDNMLTSSKETYDYFNNAFSRDSFDDNGAIMDSIFNRGYSCPNASWNGTFISFCTGLTTDDVTAHEWGHAYTQYTHGLIYAWQPGALNESYSDMWGETVDRINGRDTVGNSATDPLRTNASTCTIYTPQPPVITINAPAAIAGGKLAGTAAWGPTVFNLTGDVALANDGVAIDAGATLSDGCCAASAGFVCGVNSWPNAAQIAGKIALVDRGTCGFVIKAKNAQNNGAIGVIVANNTTGIVNMAGADATATVPALSIGQADGAAIKAQLLSTTVNATLTRVAGTGTDASSRWLVGEDDTNPGLFGALRDMYAPPCYFNPAKVSDAFYGCGAADNGGVHNNSGVPNHAYALIVDGGTYNGQTITGIGLTKTAHVYYRAMTVYQHPTSNFIDHANAVEQSAADLLGVNLPDLVTGLPSGQAISAGDITQIQKAMLAVEMRTPPTQCNFQPVLGQNPPADPACGAGTARVNLLVEGFEGSTAGWTISRDDVGAGNNEPDWTVSSTLPDGRAGKAFFAEDPNIGGCSASDDESGVRHLTSPAISLPVGSTGHTVTFTHWVATELGFDGGQLRISVNGGPFTVVPQANFLYNAHNVVLQTAGQGNTNPQAGQRAWSGTDAGAVDGTWGKSIVSLAGLATAGDSIQLRWDMGTDGCGGTTFGWYVDDVTVYACLPTANPTISIDNVSVTEGNSGTTNATFTISLSHASTKTITMRAKSNNGTAKKDEDFINVAEKTVTIAPLAGSVSYVVQVKGDTKVEPNETFFVDLSNATNATFADAQGQGTITNDD